MLAELRRLPAAPPGAPQREAGAEATIMRPAVASPVSGQLAPNTRSPDRALRGLPGVDTPAPAIRRDYHPDRLFPGSSLALPNEDAIAAWRLNDVAIIASLNGHEIGAGGRIGMGIEIEIPHTA
jgi:hypothetical protein